MKVYIEMNFDGMREKIVRMIAGESIKINVGKFQNDMTTFHSADDVMTLLVHLGYLTYDFNSAEVRIPNSEVQQEFINSIEDGGWEYVMNSLRLSDELLEILYRAFYLLHIILQEKITRFIENLQVAKVLQIWFLFQENVVRVLL